MTRGDHNRLLHCERECISYVGDTSRPFKDPGVTAVDHANGTPLILLTNVEDILRMIHWIIIYSKIKSREISNRIGKIWRQP